jgi:outer membrane protein TolC
VSRPDYKLSIVKIESARQNLQLTKKAWFPQITFEGQYQIGGKSFTSNTGYNIGGYLNFPTINGMLIRNEIKEAKTLHNREIANARSTQNDIYLEIQTAYYNLIEKRAKIPVSTLTVKQAKENYDLSFGRYKAGVGNPVELKEAQLQYRDAQLNYYNTLYLYNTARAELERAIGKNIVENQISINLDSKTINKAKKDYKKEIKNNLQTNSDHLEIEQNVIKKAKNKKSKKENKSIFKTLKEITS